MKLVVLIISLFFIVCIAGINVTLLYDNYSDYGISKNLSIVISTLGTIPTIILLLIRSGIKKVVITKIITLVTMATPAIVDEQRIFSPMLNRELYLYLNVIVVLLGIASIIAIHKKSSFKI